MVKLEQFIPTNVDGMTFEFDSSANLMVQKSPHWDCWNIPESKLIRKPAIILNHSFFYDCYQAKLPLNFILAVHLKKGTIVKSIKRMLENGNRNNSSNNTDLSNTAWIAIVNNMIDILYHNIAREYKTLPQQLVDLITANPELSVNLNTDQKGWLLRCFVGFPIAWHVGTLTLPIYITDCFFYKTLLFNSVVFNLCSKTPYSDTILLFFAILPIKKQDA